MVVSKIENVALGGENGEDSTIHTTMSTLQLRVVGVLLKLEKTLISERNS